MAQVEVTEPTTAPDPVPARRGPRVTLWLTVIVTLALGPKLLAPNAPFLDAFWMRDLLSASVAHNYLADGINLLWPEADYTPDRSNYVAMEFPLAPALAAAVWRVTGEHEWVLRLLSALWSSLGIIVFFAICRQFLHRPSALAATWVFALSPISLFMGRKFMPEPLALLCLLLCIWAFLRWLVAERPQWLVAAAAAGAVAALLRPPLLHVLLLLAWLAYQQQGKRAWTNWRNYAFAAAVVVPVALWLNHAAAIGRDYWSVDFGADRGQWFSPRLLAPATLSLMVARLCEEVLTPVGAVGAAIGLVLLRRGDRQTFFAVWLAAAGLAMLIVLGENVQQVYHQLWLAPPGAGLVGLAWERLALRTQQPGRLTVMLVAILLLFSVWGVQRYYSQDTPVLAARDALDRLDPRHEPVIVYPAGYNCLYYLERLGWCGRDSHQGEGFGAVGNPRYVADRVARGARWCLIFTRPQPAEFRDLVMERHMAGEAGFRLAYRDSDFEIYDLRPPTTR